MSPFGWILCLFFITLSLCDEEIKLPSNVREYLQETAQNLDLDANKALEQLKEMKELLLNLVDASEGKADEKNIENDAKISINTDGSAENIPTAIDCNQILSCGTCIAHVECAWCLSQRACRVNQAWECQGDEDHVSLTMGHHHVCPLADENSEESKRRQERRKRKEEAKKALNDKGDNTEGEKKKRQSKGSIAREQKETKEDLTRRAELSKENYGMSHPYETLEVETNASSGEIRKAYRKLSLLFHPDKNNGSEEANLAFKDIVAAFEIIGDPDKRSVFDDIGNTSESFFSEQQYRQHGQKNEGNFYQGNPLITALTEQLWEKRVGSNDDVWIVEFYAPWCGPCQQMVPIYKSIADLLQHDTGIEMGAVNCATQANLCGTRFGIRGYPTILAVNDKHGTRQEFHGPKGVHEVVKWARDLAKEWRFLFKRQNIINLSDRESFRVNVVDTDNFVIVAFLDGLDCSSCMTAKTNLMRLSAGLRGYENVTVALVDCEDPVSQGLCYQDQQIPPKPHAPIIKAYQSGKKHASIVGETLYNSNDMEPHLAMEIMERLIRLILNDRLSSSSLSEGNVSSFEKNKGEEDDEEEEQHEPPPKQWNGPARNKPLPWNGGGGGVSRFSLGH